jgi:hypothetical protein
MFHEFLGRCLLFREQKIIRLTAHHFHIELEHLLGKYHTPKLRSFAFSFAPKSDRNERSILCRKAMKKKLWNLQ